MVPLQRRSVGTSHGTRFRHLAYRELGATGLAVAEDAPAELGISLALSCGAARSLMAEAIDLVHRLPHTWTAGGRGGGMGGRRIARLTRELTDQAAGWVDDQLTGCLTSLPVGRPVALAEAKATAADAADASQDQTHPGNLGKLTRSHHRIKTHAPGWRTWQLDDHTHLWRTPHGRYRITDQTGTHLVETADTGPPGPPKTTSPLERQLTTLIAAAA